MFRSGVLEEVSGQQCARITITEVNTLERKIPCFASGLLHRTQIAKEGRAVATFEQSWWCFFRRKTSACAVNTWERLI